MKTAYLFLVHDQPSLTAKIIDTVAINDNAAFVHVDKKSNEGDFKNALSSKQNISFINNRVHCKWGMYSLIQATLNLLKEAINKDNFDHYILLSGRDYLIKSPRFINNFLQKNKGVDFFEYYELPDKRLCEREDGIYRVNRYHYLNKERHKEFPPYSKKPILNPLFNAAAKVYYSTIRKMPLDMKVYAGSQWWILSSETVHEVLNFLSTNNNIEKFFKNVWIPDEIFFQTIIMHLKKDSNHLVNNNYRHISWQVEDKSRFIHIPTILTEKNFDELANSKAFFARKFDAALSKGLINKIDEKLLQAVK